MKPRKTTIGDLIIYGVLLVYGLMIIYPFYNAVLVSLVPRGIYLRNPFMLYPLQVTFNSYQYVLSRPSILNGFKTTGIIMIVGVLYNMVLTTTVAYALSKPIPGRKIFNLIIIFTVYFSGGLVPFYILIREVGLMDSISSMILPTGFSVFYMIVIRSFFMELPAELEESAKIDGANDITIFFRIILPLSLPILATFTLYYAVERWNEWWNAMLFIRSPEKFPLQYVIRTIVMEESSDISSSAMDHMQTFSQGVRMASIIVCMLPVMCLYPFLQKYFIRGLTVGAIK